MDDTDYTLKHDQGKLDVTLVPSEAVRAIARVMEAGLKKGYGRGSWKKVEPNRYRAALYRHLLDYIDDPDHIDAETGLPTIELVLCNAAFLSVLEKYKPTGPSEEDYLRKTLSDMYDKQAMEALTEPPNYPKGS